MIALNIECACLGSVSALGPILSVCLVLVLDLLRVLRSVRVPERTHVLYIV